MAPMDASRLLVDWVRHVATDPTSWGFDGTVSGLAAMLIQVEPTAKKMVDALQAFFAPAPSPGINEG